MSYDAFATTFSNSRKNLHWPELEYIIEDIKDNEYRSILDVGCGNGRFLKESEKLWYIADQYLGVDNSKGMILEARKLHPESHFEAIWMQDMVNIEGSFDAIVFLASFHHLGNGDFDIKIGEFSRYYHGFTLIELEELFKETEYEIIENRIFEGGRNFISIISL